MGYIVGVLAGYLLIAGVIAFPLRPPAKRRKKRRPSDHDGWNDTNFNLNFQHQNLTRL
jgi:hypothetical protein